MMKFLMLLFPRPHEIVRLLQDLQFHFALTLRWIIFYCQMTSYDQQQLDFKRCGSDQPGCAFVKFAGMFGDHINKSVALMKVLALSAFVSLCSPLAAGMRRQELSISVCYLGD